MQITAQGWGQISFPVYRISKYYKVQREGNILYTSTEYVDAEGHVTYRLRILDDKNIDAPTLGLRRAKIASGGTRLLRLPKAYFFLGDIIKDGNSNFIDSNGLLFTYVKTRTVPLLFKRIVKRFPVGLGTIIELEGIPTRFKTLYSVQPNEYWAGVLKIGSSYVLYGVYTEPFKTKSRKI